ncbi:helix-hairpin-helix domain-containing protein [Bacillus sp. 1P06AnD]|uniref:helix-hairpin-helix domain-containing protein n=1 Tax=Bacillus sp. 1P06AnD TaxID=3132208 RepID=UPI0039A05A7B
MKYLSDKKNMAIAALALTVAVGGLLWFSQSGSSSDAQQPWDTVTQTVSNEPKAKESTPVEAPKVIKVDIKGAVHAPGVFIAEKDDRILDIIEKAGGFKKEANANEVNLAQRVEDQMTIYVPVVGEETAPAPAVSTTGQNAAAGGKQTDGKINLNTADQTQLQELTGIGPSKAEAIIQYRTEKGSFSSVEDLKNVSGIGEKTFEKIKDQISI